MPTVYRRGEYYSTGYITGPQVLSLWLDLQPERLDEPFVNALELDEPFFIAVRQWPFNRDPESAVVRAAVLAGTDQANAELHSSLHPFEIRYLYSGYDFEQCSLMRWGAYAIVQAVVTGRVVDGSEPRSGGSP